MNSIRLIALLFACVYLSACTANKSKSWTQDDYLQAYQEAKQYADRGEPWAQLRLGILYDNGWGVEEDKDTALSWYRKASTLDAIIKYVDTHPERTDTLLYYFYSSQLYFKDGKVVRDPYLKHSKEVLNQKTAGVEDLSILFCCEYTKAQYLNRDQNDVEGLKFMLKLYVIDQNVTLPDLPKSS